LKSELESLQAVRKSVDRPVKLRRLHELKAQEEEQAAELAKNSVMDPAELKRLVDQTEVCKQAGNRWTDNMWTLKKYLMKKKGISSKEVKL
jgi:hypothetical protein